MYRILFLLILWGCSTTSPFFSQEINLVHFNIKELSSEKLAQASNPQLAAVHTIIKEIQMNEGEIDLLSLNEIQFDKKGVPNSNFQSEGQNLNKLAQRLELEFAHSIFSEANTGKNAKTDQNGNYTTSRKNADQVNFGLFPGQYSTGALSNIKVIAVNVIDKIRWKQFNPNIDFSKFRLANGETIPEDIQLFDKNFTDMTLETKGGKRFHLILLHTVPAFHFGNKKTVNYQRNADQLRFLEWYLTGQTDIGVPKLIEDGNRISPLPAGSRFIATGDWNTSIKNNENLGSWVLKRLFNKTRPWVSIEEMSFTNEGASYGSSSMRLMLDYIVTDQDTKILKGKIYHPRFKIQESFCDMQLSEKVKTEMQNRQTTQNRYVFYKTWAPKFKRQIECHALVDKSYLTYKTASDHYPLFLKFKL